MWTIWNLATRWFLFVKKLAWGFYWPETIFSMYINNLSTESNIFTPVSKERHVQFGFECQTEMHLYLSHTYTNHGKTERRGQNYTFHFSRHRDFNINLWKTHTHTYTHTTNAKQQQQHTHTHKKFKEEFRHSLMISSYYEACALWIVTKRQHYLIWLYVWFDFDKDCTYITVHKSNVSQA